MGIHAGASIGANVRLIRPLSRGGMGSVWRAEHLTLHTEVAVKFVSDALIGDQGFLARFTREAVASARIKSPHVVQIFDHGVTADGVPYIVMELLEGEDLRSRLLRETKLPLAATTQVVTQAARGLARAHAASIVHRDIKPGNIFLMEHDGDLLVKILDFGIAKQIGDMGDQVTMTGQIIGTPHYVSPEQIERPRDADPQNDLWSLAVVAYRCLTGELPFEGESVGAVAIAIDKAEFTPVTAREPTLPRMLDAWFARAFARVPTARFGSAKELAAAFEAAARDEPLSSILVEDSLRTALPPPGGAAPSEPTVQERARAADAPTAGEPTLSHGTVTHIELTAARRTKLYGGVIAGVAILGAITVGLLSRGDDSPGSTATTATAGAAAGTPAPTVSPAAAPTVEPTATAASAVPAPTADPSSSERPAPSTAKSAAPAPAAPASSPRKKKDRGF